MKSMKYVVSLAVLLVIIVVKVDTADKYSKELNQPFNDDFMQKEKPFRVNKVNLLWIKAKQVKAWRRKVKKLGKELLVQDKEEIKLKRMKTDGQDKEGLKEAEVRKKFHYIMERYNLLKHMDTYSDKQPKEFNEAFDDQVVKSIFKDKKLNKLWEKAEKSVKFSVEELMTLKQEFKHHQEKVDDYYSLLNDLHTEDENAKDSFDNSIDQYLNSETKSKKPLEQKMQSLREKHVQLKEEYDELHQKSVGGPFADEFRDPKVKILWKLAREADFSIKELESIREELQHYEQRANKLLHLETELLKMNEKHDDDTKIEAKSHVSKKIKQLSHKVNKLHEDLEVRIKKRHYEL
ncbi:Alpha-2-macroglobulin receptor-associated protein [Nymphon striatum]|nr:Alpha-2-macroglobulin receptor-associated protein [Nymphon striatum]